MDESVSAGSGLTKIKGRFPEIFSSPAWAGQVDFVSLTDQGLEIQVANLFVRDWIKENYLTRILQVCFQEVGRECPIRFVVSQTALPYQEIPIPRDEKLAAVPRAVELKPLNSKYFFSHFVVGTSNQFAHAASMAVAKNPSEHYNPLLIYGGVGLGKTHLLHAIGHEILKNQPHAKILYLSSERFMNELIHAIRFGKTSEFRSKYRDSCDVLLMDDIQFIAGKERTQDEFFHTFNFLHEARKQIVLTSDKAPKDIAELESRLRSRLEWGLIADIQIPDLETRTAILKKKARDNHIPLSDEVAFFVASHVKSNVRELEGALIRVHAFASLSGASITVDFAKETLKNVLGGVGHVISMDQIQKIVSDFYGITLNELTGRCRVKSHSLPRQIAMFLCRKIVKASFPEIGTKFGGKDHSTVVHAVSKIELKLEEDPHLRDQMVSLERQLAH